MNLFCLGMTGRSEGVMVRSFAKTVSTNQVVAQLLLLLK